MDTEFYDSFTVKKLSSHPAATALEGRAEGPSSPKGALLEAFEPSKPSLGEESQFVFEARILRWFAVGEELGPKRPEANTIGAVGSVELVVSYPRFEHVPHLDVWLQFSILRKRVSPGSHFRAGHHLQVAIHFVCHDKYLSKCQRLQTFSCPSFHRRSHPGYLCIFDTLSPQVVRIINFA
jgi:hypothetical protein